jgi:hypothetical protein
VHRQGCGRAAGARIIVGDGSLQADVAIFAGGLKQQMKGISSVFGTMAASTTVLPRRSLYDPAPLPSYLLSATHAVRQ